MPSLLFAPDLGAPGSALALSREEAHYVARVCRAREGDFAEATDGRGALARLRLLSVGREVRAEVVSVERQDRTMRAWLLCGAPERGRADWLVEKLAELGVERFQPLDCDGAPWPAGAARLERWRRIAIAALRQSRRAHLLEIRPPVSVEVALAGIDAPADRWIGDAGGRVIGVGPTPPGGVGGSASAVPERAAHWTPRVPDPVGPALQVGAIGPSCGFTTGERKCFEAAGFEPIRLADGRLRTETAAVSMAAWWAAGIALTRAASQGSA